MSIKGYEARGKMNYAITSGKMPRAGSLFCAYCGNKASQYHHHLGYEPEFAFAVFPCCRDCHLDQHRKPPPKKNNEEKKSTQCKAITKFHGKRCKCMTYFGDYCYWHRELIVVQETDDTETE